MEPLCETKDYQKLGSYKNSHHILVFPHKISASEGWGALKKFFDQQTAEFLIAQAIFSGKCEKGCIFMFFWEWVELYNAEDFLIWIV